MTTTEIIAIGDEIIAGNIIDTNTAYLSDFLWRQGYDVAYHTSVRDDESKIREALIKAGGRAKIVLVTGGLGPTVDDFTIEVASHVFKKRLVRDVDYEKYLIKLFKKRKRDVSASLLKQALKPQGADVFQNQVGTAPGIGLTFRKTRYYFMPGVPKEMRHLFEKRIFNDIEKHTKRKNKIATTILRCFGTGESQIDSALADLFQDRLTIQGVRIGYRAHFPETFVKLSAWGASQKQANHSLIKVKMEILKRVGKYVYAEGENNLESVVGGLLHKKKKTLSLAESCTGGTIASRLTSIPGSSQYFMGGCVSYSNETKKKMLGVKEKTLSQWGAVSEAVAIEMARGIRKKLQTDYALAVTGIAGPSGGSKDKPVGLVYLALATSHKVITKSFIFDRNREWFILYVSSVALDMLRKEMEGLE